MENEILSISQLTEQARAVPFNPNIPLRYWVATVQTVLREAEIYEREGNIQKAYGQYYRYVEFVIKRLPEHPEAKSKDKTNSSVRELRRQMRDVPKIMDRMDRLKPLVDAAYQREQRRRRHDYELRKEMGNSRPPSSQTGTQLMGPRPESRIARKPVPGTYYPSDRDTSSVEYIDRSRRRDSEFAERIAGREFERRESERRRRRDFGISERDRDRGHIRSDSASSTGQRDLGVGSPTNDESAVRSQYLALKQQYDLGYQQRQEPSSRYAGSSSSSKYDLDDDLAGTIRRLGMQANMQRQPPREDSHSPSRHAREQSRDSSRQTGNWAHQYPSVPKRSTPSMPLSPPDERDYTSSKSTTPALPPKLRYDTSEYRSTSPIPPPVPQKSPFKPPPSPQPYARTPDISPSITTAPKVPPLPPVPQELTKQPETPKEEPGFTFEPSAFLEDGRPLRTVFLPEGLRKAFLKIAEPNTRSNLETCGILCGSLVQNALFISKLVIPEQEATSDTCTTKDEEDLFSYVFGDDLLILGWIHTHPTQTCFMSSVDLHTHCSYQLMLDESIAIVCAPKSDPSWGVFRLTDPPGINIITNCREKGLFHPHPGDGGIYQDALRPGHVALIGSSFDVVDLRKSKLR